MDRPVSPGNWKYPSGTVLIHQPVICQGTRRSERNGFHFLSWHRALASTGTSPIFHLLVDASGPKFRKASRLPTPRKPAGSVPSCFFLFPGSLGWWPGSLPPVMQERAPPPRGGDRTVRKGWVLRAGAGADPTPGGRGKQTQPSQEPVE